MTNTTNITDTAAHIDIEDAMDRLCNDYELLKTILSLFCEEKCMEANSIMEMIASKNTYELNAWNHQSLGIARNLSLPGIIADLEKMATLIKVGDYQSLPVVYQDMLKELTILREISKKM